MAHRGLVAAGTVLVLLSSVPLFRVTKVNFTPEDDQSQFDVTLRAPEGTSLAAMNVIANRMSTAIRRIPEVEFTLVTVAGDTAGTLNTASMLVKLHPIEARDRDQFAVMAEVRDTILPQFKDAGLRTAVQLGGGPGGGGGAIQFMMQGPDLDRLAAFSDALRKDVAAIPGLVDVDTSLNAGKPELSIDIDRPKAADLGVQVADAAEAIRLLVAGDQVTTYNDAGEQYEVHLRAQEQNRGSLGRPGRAAGAVVAPRRRLARQPGQLRPQRRAGDDQPDGPPAAGDHQRQPAAGHVAGQRRRSRSSPPPAPCTSRRNTAPASSAARAS